MLEAIVFDQTCTLSEYKLTYVPLPAPGPPVTKKTSTGGNG